MKIGVISHYYPPDEAGNIPRTVAHAMRERGHDVRVLTTFPHYADGKISNGYKQSLNYVESDGDVIVRRLPIYPSHSRNPIGRIANYLSFPLSARFARKWLADVDVVYVHGTPATPSETARSLCARYGIPFVFSIQDIWPDSVTNSGFLPQPALNQMEKGINRWLRSVYSRASAIITIAPSAKRLLITRGVPETCVHVVYNWSEAPVLIGRPNSSGFSLLYAGNLGEFQDLRTVLEAIKGVSHLEGLRLTIAGGGVEEERLRSLVAVLGLEKVVEFVGKVDPSDMGSLYAQSDFHIVPLKNLNFFAGTIPSKFQKGLAHGLPVITTVKGDVSNLVSSNDLGFTARPEDPEDLARAFKQAYETTPERRIQLSQNARSFFESNFTEQHAMDRIEEILIAAAKTRGADGRKVDEE